MTVREKRQKKQIENLQWALAAVTVSYITFFLFILWLHGVI